MVLVGLSGGLGSGKSTVGRALAAKGATVIDTDEVARHVLAPGSPGERAAIDHFGRRVTKPDGTLDRKALAAIVFADDAELEALETITHPRVYEEVLRRATAPAAGVVVIEIPLLDDRRRQQYGLDLVVLVDAPEELAVHRAVARGMTEDDARARIAAQPTYEARRRAADLVVDNAGTVEALDAQLTELWSVLKAHKPQHHPPPQGHRDP